MVNDMTLLLTTSTYLADEVTSNENNSSDLMESFLRDDLTASLWRWVWPLLCVTGLVGNTLVVLVLRRDGLVRTSANVYLTALAVGDSLVLMMASVAFYPGLAWGYWLEGTSTCACRTIRPVHYTLTTASIWIIAAFTVERCVATRSVLLKARMHTPRSAGLCCVALLVVACVTNIDLVFMSTTSSTLSGGVFCHVPLRYLYYMAYYRPWINIVVTGLLPACTVLFCNLSIIRQLRRGLMPTAVRDSVRRTTSMCLCVSLAFVTCVVPYYVFAVVIRFWPMTQPAGYGVFNSLFLLQYVNYAVNVFLYSLTGAHFRGELAAVFRSCIQRACATAAVVRGMPSRVTGRFQLRQGFEEDLEMR